MPPNKKIIVYTTEFNSGWEKYQNLAILEAKQDCIEKKNKEFFCIKWLKKSGHKEKNMGNIANKSWRKFMHALYAVETISDFNFAVYIRELLQTMSALFWDF